MRPEVLVHLRQSPVGLAGLEARVAGSRCCQDSLCGPCASVPTACWLQLSEWRHSESRPTVWAVSDLDRARQPSHVEAVGRHCSLEAANLSWCAGHRRLSLRRAYCRVLGSGPQTAAEG